MDPLIVLSTFPDLEVAREVAQTLVEERLAACVNLCPGVESIYRWQEEVETAAEVLGVIKTAPDRVAALQARLAELHPYDVPEIVVLPSAGALEAYAAWVAEAVKPAGA